MKKQKYYLVLAEANTPPLAMFAMREWAEAWKITHCATAIIEDFDMLIRLPLPNGGSQPRGQNTDKPSP